MPDLKKRFLTALKNIKGSGEQRGVSLYFSMMIVTILLGIALGISTILLGQVRMIKGMEDSTTAFFAADTGAERVLYNIYTNYFEPITSGSLGNATYRVTLNCGKNYNDCPEGLSRDPNCSASYFCLQSVGKFKEVKRAIEVTR